MIPRLLESPNFNQRPADVTIDLVVIHGISLPAGEFGGAAVEELFLNRLDCSQPPFESLDGVRVSAHLFINRKGEVTQFVPYSCRAWHAGKSEWLQQPDCNDYSIGIELEGSDRVAYTPRQYDALIDVLRGLMIRYPQIEPARIVGHADIAPERKSDPGPAFNWPALRRRLGRP